MGREVKRVPLDFDWPLDKPWEGFLMPDRLHETNCKSCDGSGYSPRARALKDLWYGNVRFKPEDNGSVPFTIETPQVRALAERNIESAPEFYGSGEQAIVREARRLLHQCFNNSWSHHLNADDVAALLEADRLWDFTRTCTPGEGWKPKDPKPIPSPQEVNAWSLSGFGHDSSNCYIVVKARCAREGVGELCESCDGHGSTEAYEGQRDEADAWRETEPPTGDGWQLWETVSEGSPISPVFATPEELAQWMASPAYTWGASTPMTIESALAFAQDGWAPSFVVSGGKMMSGEEFVGSALTSNGGDN